MSDDRLYSSTELTQALGCTRKALRVYQQHGLIAPDRQHGNRRYSGATYQRLRLIAALRTADVSIPDIKRLLGIHDSQPTGAGGAQLLVGELSNLIRLVTDRVQTLSDVRERLIVARETLLDCTACKEVGDACHDCASSGRLDSVSRALVTG
jgi:DNA-binding transcriptional MerR regulator